MKSQSVAQQNRDVTVSHCQNMKSQSITQLNRDVTVSHCQNMKSQSITQLNRDVTVSHCQKIESQSITELNRDVTVSHCQKIESQSITQLKHDVTVGHGNSQFQNFDFRASGTAQAWVSHRQEQNMDVTWERGHRQYVHCTSGTVQSRSRSVALLEHWLALKPEAPPEHEYHTSGSETWTSLGREDTDSTYYTTPELCGQSADPCVGDTGAEGTECATWIMQSSCFWDVYQFPVWGVFFFCFFFWGGGGGGGGGGS